MIKDLNNSVRLGIVLLFIFASTSCKSIEQMESNTDTLHIVEVAIPQNFRHYSIFDKLEQQNSRANKIYKSTNQIYGNPSTPNGRADLPHPIKLMAQCDSESHFLYCWIANTGKQEVIFNDYLVGYHGSVNLEYKGQLIPRVSATRFMHGCGPSSSYNLRLPAQSMYQSNKKNCFGVRVGPWKKKSPGYSVAKWITHTPKKVAGIAFCEDLLDFNWEAITVKSVQVTVVQQLVSIVPSKSLEISKYYILRSPPIIVDVHALNEYKMTLKKYKRSPY